jgi:hypothetical protein
MSQETRELLEQIVRLEHRLVERETRIATLKQELDRLSSLAQDYRLEGNTIREQLPEQGATCLKCDGMPIEKLTVPVSNMWKIAAIVEVLERKGLCTKHDLYDIITEFRRKNPEAQIPETTFPEPYLLTETENAIIDDIFELLNKYGLTSHQSMNLLERLGRIMEMGQRVVKGTTH